MTAPQHPCPSCGRETTLLAGIVLYEGHKDAYPERFEVCWSDNIHRQRGRPEWLPLPSLARKVLKWTVHSNYHWSMKIHGEQLH